VLNVRIDPTGIPTVTDVLQSLGFGLDEKAIESVKQWRFIPGIKDGKRVTVETPVEVNFRLR
jgi:protein TonB